MFAVVFVSDFSLQAVLRLEPELVGRSVAIVDAVDSNLVLRTAMSAAPKASHKAVVLECTAPAREAGVGVGFTAPQAMARCRELVLKPRSAAAERSATDLLLQTAGAFSPYLEHTGPGVCTIDLRGLDFAGQAAVMHDGEQPSLGTAALSSIQQDFGFPDCSSLETTPSAGALSRHRAAAPLFSAWGDRIRLALHQLGLEARIGFAAAPDLALLAAQAARPVLVVIEPERFLDELPIEALQPTAGVGDVLERWGIRTAGAFLALGRDAVAARLGGEALELFERASMAAIRPLDLVVPADTFSEEMAFEAQIETIEPLLFVLRRFIEQLATRIALAGRVVAELQLTLTLEPEGRHERTFRVPSPTANIETLFRMVRTHLENLRTDAPIVALRLGAEPARAEAQQFNLFDSTLRDPNHFHETLARLAALLGPERVGTPVIEATHQPDSFHMRMPEFQQGSAVRGSGEGNDFHAGLCLRRFRAPVPAEVEARAGQPLFFSSLAVSSPVLKARGPWEGSGGWWDNRRWVRQEWDVAARDGSVYRLSHADGRWVVEGVYD